MEAAQGQGCSATRIQCKLASQSRQTIDNNWIKNLHIIYFFIYLFI